MTIRVFLVIMASIMILSLGLMSCSILPDSDLGEYKVPDTYATYTDKNRLFSISYPSDWIIEQQHQSYFEDESDSFNEFLGGDKSAILPPSYCPTCPPEIPSWPLFMAYKKDEKNKAHVRVAVLSTLGRYPQGATKEQVYNIVMATKDYTPFFQETLRIAGNEVAILKLPNTGPLISIASVLIVDDIIWVVSCAEDGQYEKDFQTIIRSLRVLK